MGSRFTRIRELLKNFNTKTEIWNCSLKNEMVLINLNPENGYLKIQLRHQEGSQVCKSAYINVSETFRSLGNASASFTTETWSVDYLKLGLKQSSEQIKINEEKNQNSIHCHAPGGSHHHGKRISGSSYHMSRIQSWIFFPILEITFYF